MTGGPVAANVGTEPKLVASDWSDELETPSGLEMGEPTRPKDKGAGLFDEMPEDPTMSIVPPEDTRRRMAAAEAPATLTLSRWNVATPTSQKKRPPASLTDAELDVEHDEEDEPTLSSVGDITRESQAPAYVLRRIVGKGGYGEVWEATQSSLGRSIAVKRMRADLADKHPQDSIEARQMELSFRQEAITTGSLEHPNIVPVHDLGVDEFGRPLLAMKLVRGKPWHKMIKEDADALGVTEFLSRHLPILVNVSQAVAFAHSRGIIHRDIKPSQVMVGEFGEVLLMDWGLAVVFDEIKAGEEVPELVTCDIVPTMETATSPSGTPAFMAPEQTENSAKRIGMWTDIYLLGGCLYYLLTLSVPHNAGDAMAAFYQAVDGEVDSPEERAPEREIPLELSILCMTSLAKDPAQRVPNVKEFIDGITDYLSGASKRRESAALTQGVAELLQAPKRNYGDLAECDNMLVRAQGLWPENPRAQPLRELVLTEYARLAINNGDLVLARVQAERLTDEHEANGIMAEIEALEARDRRQARQRKVLFLATIFLSLFMGVGGFAALLFKAEGKEQEERKQLSQEQAARQTKVSTLLRRINEMRSAELKLAGELGRQIPVPDRLADNDPTGVHMSIPPERLDELMKQLEALRKERNSIASEPELPFNLGDSPMELQLAEANLQVYRAETAEEHLKAFDFYRAAAEANPSAPEPLLGMGIASARAGYYKSAVEYLSEATSVTLALRGPNHADYAESLILLSDASRNLDAQSAGFKETLASAHSSLEPRWGQLSLMLADQARDLGQVDEAISYAKPIYELYVKRFGTGDAQTADAMESLGLAYQMAGRSDEAEPLLVGALDIRRAKLGTGNVKTISSLSMVAKLFDSHHLYDKAEPLHAEAMEQAMILLGAKHPTVLDMLFDRAENLAAQGAWREALPYLSQARDSAVDSQGQRHPLTAEASLRLGELQSRLDGVANSEAAARQGLDIYRESVGELNPETTLAYARVAACLRRMGKLREAETNARKAIELITKRQGSDADIAFAELELAETLRDMGSREKAMESALHALSLYSKAGNADSPGAARGLSLVGALVAADKRFDDAIVLESSAFAIMLANLGPGHAETLASAERYLDHLLDAYHASPDPERFKKIVNTAAWIEDRWIANPFLRRDVFQPGQLRVNEKLTDLFLSVKPSNASLAKALLVRSAAIARLTGLAEQSDWYRQMIAARLETFDLKETVATLAAPPEALWPTMEPRADRNAVIGYLDSVAPADWRSSVPGLDPSAMESEIKAPETIDAGIKLLDTIRQGFGGEGGK